MARHHPLYGTVQTQPPASYRQGGQSYSDPSKFPIQSCTMTWSWGSEPATGTIVYTGNAPVTIGASTRVELAGYVFHGVCKSDTPMVSSQGNLRTLEFADNREFLDWDLVYCAFNKREDRIVGNRRMRRYWHIFPRDFDTLTKTYTDAPLTAGQILDLVFNAPTVEDRWVRVYHPDQVLYPVYDIDALGGKKLKAALQEISDAQGLLFTLLGGPFRLVWIRKGEGLAPAIPAGTDNRVSGATVSGHPTRIRVLGGRNLYQVRDLPLVKDWKSAWEQFYDISLFANDIYNRGSLTAETRINGYTFPAGTTFAAIGANSTVDREQVVSRQLALARALEITVGEYAALRNDTSFLDFRKFHGRSRLDMPAALYIQQLLFRAFRLPDGFFIRNAQGRAIPAHSLRIAEKMVAGVSHDPLTGRMAWDISASPDGNGYAIAKGYQVGRDLFRTIKPDRFRIEDWKSAQEVWEHIEFQVDDSGEADGRYILFDEPVIRSEDLVDLVDGYAVFKASPTISVPEVRAALTFEAEQFSYVAGFGTRDEVENVSSLNAEFVSGASSAPVEIQFSDGQTAGQKAAQIAAALLSRQYAYARGSFTFYPKPDANGVYPAGMTIGSCVDRVTISMAPNGCRVDVDLTSEQPRTTYIPERDLDRAARINALLPGQTQLREEANTARLIAAAIKVNPRALKTVSEAFRGQFGSGEPVDRVLIENGSSDPLPVGTPIHKRPTNTTSGTARNTLAAHPVSTTPEHTEFAGVTVRSGEVTDQGEILVQKTGDILARVMGPVSFGDRVGSTPGQTYLDTSASSSVGVAQQEIAEAEVKLIRVRVSPQSRPGAEVLALWCVEEFDYFLKCVDDAGTVYAVAKPPTLQSGDWNPGWSGGYTGVTLGGSDATLPVRHWQYGVAYRYIDACNRYKLLFPRNGLSQYEIEDIFDGLERNGEPLDLPPKTLDYTISHEVIDPPYTTGVAGANVNGGSTVGNAQIFAIRAQTGLLLPDWASAGGAPGTFCNLIDLNLAARRWVDLQQTYFPLMEINGRSFPQGKIQWEDQLLSNSNPQGFQEP